MGFTLCQNIVQSVLLSYPEKLWYIHIYRIIFYVDLLESSIKGSSVFLVLLSNRLNARINGYIFLFIQLLEVIIIIIKPNIVMLLNVQILRDALE